MAFTTWTALRTAMKDAYADHIASGSFAGSYSMGGRSLTYRSEKEFWDCYERTYRLEALETTGDPGTRVSYGKCRRFR